jgi:hypothetical protein
MSIQKEKGKGASHGSVSTQILMMEDFQRHIPTKISQLFQFCTPNGHVLSTYIG